MSKSTLTFRSRRLGPGRVARDCWLEVPLTDGWVAAHRLVPQNGRPVLAELRIFHRDEQRAPSVDGVVDDAYHYEAGEWAAETEGFGAPVPDGGLTARMVKAVKAGAFLDDATEHMREMERAWGKEVVHEEGGVLSRHGFTAGSSQSKERRGRPPSHRDIWYAILARDYCRIINAGNHKRPVKELAAARGYKAQSMSRLLNQAREKGMLTPTPPGRAGGQLTSLAVMLLKEAGEESR